MCFSANASFVTGSVLLAGGIASLKYAKGNNQIPFASIPLIFSIQQFCEGILWLSIEKPEYAPFHDFSKYAFMLFAQVVWPFWVPFSVFLFENNEGRKKIIKITLALGVIVAAYLGFCILNFPLTATAEQYHISYHLNYPHQGLLLIGALYFIPTVFPPLFSSLNSVKIIGLLNLFSYLLTKYYFESHVISVWCFFAAVISITVLLAVKKNNQAT
jgi:hypothetical protein